MKNLIWAAICAAMFTSCSHTLYNPKVLQGNYDTRMDSKQELSIKSKVRIYLSEKDIQGDYEVISLNKYSPMISIPVLMSKKAQTDKKFYEKAVKKAYEQGGNGIIIIAGDCYKVISLNDWDSDNAETAEFTNAILDTRLMDRFNSGEVVNLSPREVKRCVMDLNNEVKFNLKTVKTSKEVEVLGEKIKALQNWNNSQAKPNSKLSKELEAYAKLQQTLKKRIEKKEAKAKKN